jgi:pimeloyl-ACP methyl ester carboxylesterase
MAGTWSLGPAYLAAAQAWAAIHVIDPQLPACRRAGQSGSGAQPGGGTQPGGGAGQLGGGLNLYPITVSQPATKPQTAPHRPAASRGTPRLSNWAEEPRRTTKGHATEPLTWKRADQDTGREDLISNCSPPDQQREQPCLRTPQNCLHPVSSLAVGAQGRRAYARFFTETDLGPMLPTIRVPVLVVHADADARSPLSVAQALHAAISGVDAGGVEESAT